MPKEKCKLITSHGACMELVSFGEIVRPEEFPIIAYLDDQKYID